jgi:hypothetical protein
MKVAGWNNGDWNASGAGYGVRISRADRDKNFKREWSSVIVKIGGREPTEIKLTDSFWKDCIELRSRAIGVWMMALGLRSWPPHKSPQFKLASTGDRSFDLSLAEGPQE